MTDVVDKNPRVQHRGERHIVGVLHRYRRHRNRGWHGHGQRQGHGPVTLLVQQPVQVILGEREAAFPAPPGTPRIVADDHPGCGVLAAAQKLVATTDTGPGADRDMTGTVGPVVTVIPVRAYPDRAGYVSI